MLLRGRMLLTGRISPVLTLMWVSHQSDTNLCFCCLCPGVKTDRANNSVRSPHWTYFPWGIFWAAPDSPQYDNDWNYAHRESYKVHSKLVPSDVTLALVPELWCTEIMVPTENTLYCHSFEVVLVYSADPPGRGHSCFEEPSNRTWLWAEDCSTAQRHWKLEIRFSVKTSCRFHLLLPLHGTFPQNLSISPKGFNTFVLITLTSLSAWEQV